MSRYRGTEIIRVIAPTGTRYRVGRRRFVTLANLGGNFREVRIKDDTNLMTLAQQYSGDFRNWYVIADLNRDRLSHPFEIPTNTLLRVPTKRGFELI